MLQVDKGLWRIVPLDGRDHVLGDLLNLGRCFRESLMESQRHLFDRQSGWCRRGFPAAPGHEQKPYASDHPERGIFEILTPHPGPGPLPVKGVKGRGGW